MFPTRFLLRQPVSYVCTTVKGHGTTFNLVRACRCTALKETNVQSTPVGLQNILYFLYFF